MAETLEGKKLVGSRSADKVMYYYKLIKHEKTGTPCHILGTQGATSGTNTKTLGTTAAKQFNIKDTGPINQQRVVNVVMTTGDGFKTDVARDLYYTWEHGEEMLLYRVDWNTLRTVNDKKVVDAEMAVVLISALPETEALNTPITQNVTFEVQGAARRYDEDGFPFTLSQDDFDDGIFTDTIKYFNFGKPSEFGVDADGNTIDNTKDDSHAGDHTATVGLDGSKPASNNQ